VIQLSGPKMPARDISDLSVMGMATTAQSLLIGSGEAQMKGNSSDRDLIRFMERVALHAGSAFRSMKRQARTRRQFFLTVADKTLGGGIRDEFRFGDIGYWGMALHAIDAAVDLAKVLSALTGANEQRHQRHNGCNEAKFDGGSSPIIPHMDHYRF
jgi:hypothetical protein